MNEIPDSPLPSAPRLRAGRTAQLGLLRLRPALFILITCVALFIAGCIKDFGTGGTGEEVVAFERLHNIDSFDTSKYTTSVPPPTQPTTSPSEHNPADEVMLSLEECRLLALRNNLDLKVELYTPAITQTFITFAQAAFEPLASGSLGFNRNNTPPTNLGPGVRSDTLNADANLQVPLQTGGFLRLDSPLSRLSATNYPGAVDPNYIVGPNVTFSKPLLRGFGPYVAAQGIRLAFYQYQQSEPQAKLAVIRVLAEADRAYWTLYSARQTLDVRRAQYASADAQLARARREARAGVIAEVDIVRAESGVADQVEQILLAENAVQSAARNLKRILNKPGLEINGKARILLATPPNNTAYSLDRDRLIRLALSQRMELLQTELQIAADTASVRVARNGMLPLLAFQYTFGLNGTGRTINGTYDQIWTKDYENHTFGLQLQIPVGNAAARAQLRQALLARLQQLATRDQQILQVRQDVLDAADNFETDWQRILASQKRVELAARTLDVETHQFELGLRTSTDVLIAQANLGDAQSSAISAVTDYQIAQVDLAFATGSSLTASGVSWREAGLEPQSSGR